MRFYITTPIYYVNDVPHLGHAYTTIVADALARFHRMRGDAHAVPHRHRRARPEDRGGGEASAGSTPQQLVDQVAPRFDETWKTLGIADDDFIRTTEPRAQAVVAGAVEARCEHPGDLYLGDVPGLVLRRLRGVLHREPAGQARRQALPGPQDAGRAGSKERSWFFRLSQVRGAAARAHRGAPRVHPARAAPQRDRRRSCEGGLRDLSVSRTSFKWGIPVPERSRGQHVIYVWMDALTNYLSACCPARRHDRRASSERDWPACDPRHRQGHPALPRGVLAGVPDGGGLPLPKAHLRARLVDGARREDSKSMPATRIDPVSCRCARVGPLGVRSHRCDALLPAARGAARRSTATSRSSRCSRGSTPSSRTTSATSSTARWGWLRQVRPFAQLPPGRRSSAKRIRRANAWPRRSRTFAPSLALRRSGRCVRAVNTYIDKQAPWAAARDRQAQQILGTRPRRRCRFCRSSSSRSCPSAPPRCARSSASAAGDRRGPAGRAARRSRRGRVRRCFRASTTIEKKELLGEVAPAASPTRPRQRPSRRHVSIRTTSPSWTCAWPSRLRRAGARRPRSCSSSRSTSAASGARSWPGSPSATSRRSWSARR